MADLPGPATPRERKRGVFEPTGLMPGSVPITASERWRKRIAINVSLLWLLFPALDLAGSHPGGLRATGVSLAVLVFIAVYGRLRRARWQGRRAAAPARAGLTLISTVLGL